MAFDSFRQFFDEAGVNTEILSLLEDNLLELLQYLRGHKPEEKLAEINQTEVLLRRAIERILKRLVDQGMPELAILLLPQLSDPHEIPFGVDTMLIDKYKEHHHARNRVWAADIVRSFEEAEPGFGKLITLTGPMYSGKSNLIADILEKALAEKRQVTVFITKGFKRPEGIRIRERDYLQARELELQDLEEFAENPGNVQDVILDEFTFLAFPNKKETERQDWNAVYEDKRNRLGQAVETLRSKGVNVILAGLDSDFRGEKFLSMDVIPAGNIVIDPALLQAQAELQANGSNPIQAYQNWMDNYFDNVLSPDHAQIREVTHFKCGAFTVMKLNNKYVVIPCECTGRSSKFMADLCFPVVMPDSLNMVHYTCVPKLLHLWQWLSEIDHEAFEALSNTVLLGQHSDVIEAARIQAMTEA